MSLARYALLLAGSFCAGSLGVARAHADTFTYTFSYAYPIPPGVVANFTYQTADLIATDTTFNPSSCSLNNASCNYVRIAPELGLINISSNGSLAGLTIQGLPAYDFTVGDHPINFGEFDIAQTVGQTPVPEPCGLALLGTGVVGIAGVVRRRLGV